MVSALPTNSNHFRRKYHNFQFYIFNYQFGQLPDKLQFDIPTVFLLKTFVVDNPWDSD